MRMPLSRFCHHTRSTLLMSFALGLCAALLSQIFLFNTADARWHRKLSPRNHRTKTSTQQHSPSVTLKKLWTQPLEGRTLAGASSNTTHAFAATQEGNLYAFNGSTGEKAWQVNVGEPVSETPLASDLLVIVGTEHGTLAAYHAHNGALAWKQTPHIAPYKGLPIEGLTSSHQNNNHHYIASLYANGALFVWDKYTGKPIWKAFLNKPCKAPPVFSNNALYASTMDGHIHAFQAQTGQPLWTHEIDGPIFSQATVWNDKLLVPSGTGALFTLNANTGNFLWSYTERQGKPLLGQPGIIQDTILVGSLSNRLGLVNGKLGFRTGEARITGGTESAIITIGHTALIQTTTGKILAINQDGRIQAKLSLPYYLKSNLIEQPIPNNSDYSSERKAQAKTTTRLFTTGQGGSLTAIELSQPTSK